MPDLLLEIGTEELPPREIAPALEQLASGIAQALRSLRLKAGPVRTYGTPRRLAAVVRQVAPRQAPAVREVRGPAAHVAFDSRGQPTEAARGFARSQGVPVEQLQVRESDGRRYAVAVLAEPGRPAAEVLPAALEEVVRGLSFSKTMRWGDGEARFARPVRWVVALWGRQVLPLQVAGVQSGALTVGHRVLDGGRRRRIPSPADYVRVLRAAGVMVDPARRRRVITAQAAALARAVGGAPVLDPSLLDEVVMSVEHPQVFRGSYSEQFLDLPRPVLVTVMQHHQKYFAVEAEGGRLLPYFIAVRDGDRVHLDTVRRGHEWVLHARLADARFFFEDDRRHRLEEHARRLEGVVVHERLGTMADKTRRITALARHLAARMLLDGHTTEALLRAATLCKADLVTKMVGEFPELQGVVGQIYAELDGEPAEVARAIGEHYRPAGASDSPPRTRLGALLGLADRVDTLVGGLAAGLAPTGSADPYGLRRVAQGVVEIVLMLGERIPLDDLCRAAAEPFGVPEAAEQALEILRQRLRASLVERGLRPDLVDAAVAVSGADLLAAAERARALQEASGRPEWGRLLTAAERAARILTPEAAPQVDPALFESAAEADLYREVEQLRPRLRQAAESGDYLQAVEALAGVPALVDRVFDEVLVMAPDARVRANRLALLRAVVDLFRTVGDFSRISAVPEAPAAVAAGPPSRAAEAASRRDTRRHAARLSTER
ncbi:MAG: glycine--tRNA ligase subunit beta [Armatimonadota bacterium]|nr:glycine--tRNA ligase subunit beta [Armatimonadota bacterium]MDR7472476.1 glycine--tRNA ligase subunit beta [Armatimonadota bacterium]MDR7507957.1 glycine--tRNA ligase subunit beta [Armatimonadota bacterium]MDR7510183.1 glycine--tRNA ligase subunit beta [Armatimonadota bacterium]MDR7517099.1 glycine--tRNA ligase subunit beta [Armatimonadota bacterium]